ASSAFTFTYDTVVSAPSVALTTDTGSSSSDTITNLSALTLSGVEAGGTVEYTTDNGAHWSTSVPSFSDGTYNLRVRQTDVAGNTSAASAVFTFTLDTAAAAPSVALNTDSGASNSDNIS